MEQEELMWSLFVVDMETALEIQPPDTWDSFPLFQLLNDYLRLDGNNYRDDDDNDISNSPFDTSVLSNVKYSYIV